MLYNPTIPKSWNRNLAYLCGLITGDGTLPNANTLRPNGKLQHRHIISFVSEFSDFCNVYSNLFKSLFGLVPITSSRNRKNRNIIYQCRIESRKVYTFLESIGVKSGRKARIAKVPRMPDKYKPYFLAGLLDTDGGKKGSGFGLSTASPYLAKFCCNSFKEMKFSFHSCPWKYKDHIYHQIYIHKRDFNKILHKIPLRNPEKINFILNNKNH